MTDKRDKPRDERRKVATDEHGKSVWVDTVNTARFELVTTQELRAILASDDESNRRAIEDAARSESDGVLARDTQTGVFQIIDDTDLQAILAADAPASRPPADVMLEPLRPDADAPDLALVSTQALRKIVGRPAESDPADDDLEMLDDPGGGFDPYNSG